MLSCGLSIHKYIAKAGTAPKTTKSESESRCIPNSLVDFNNLATLPSSMSKTDAIIIIIITLSQLPKRA